MIENKQISNKQMNRIKLQSTNNKPQTNSKWKLQNEIRLSFRIWILFVIWILLFGISYDYLFAYSLAYVRFAY